MSNDPMKEMIMYVLGAASHYQNKMCRIDNYPTCFKENYPFGIGYFEPIEMFQQAIQLAIELNLLIKREYDHGLYAEITPVGYGVKNGDIDYYALLVNRQNNAKIINNNQTNIYNTGGVNQINTDQSNGTINKMK